MSETRAEERRRRSDGERTHQAILEVATRLASVEGLEGLTIGRLAGELGVSKSGVYAHFGSKAELQRETVEAAWEVFEREVLVPTSQAPDGLARLRALVEAHLSYVERLVFPGGCFFASLLAEMDAREGPMHEQVRGGVSEWLGMIQSMVEEAQRRGELDEAADAAQLGFEIDSSLELANYYYVLFRDPELIARARRAIEGALARAGAEPVAEGV